VPSDLFRTKIEDGEFLEWAEVHGNYYGTSKIVTEQVRASGEDILLDVDVQGAAQVRKAQPDAITLFVMPPSFEVLEERLRGRRQDSDEVIAGRLEEARHEIHHYKDYDYVLINDSVERTSELLKAIVLAERTRPRLLTERIRPIVESFKE
jgi:guanylate kinase